MILEFSGGPRGGIRGQSPGLKHFAPDSSPVGSVITWSMPRIFTKSCSFAPGWPDPATAPA